MKGDLYIIDSRDSVGVLVKDNKDIKAGSKIALKDIAEGEAVIKYGSPIGVASRAINKGEWVHTHNLVSALPDTSKLKYVKAAPNTIDPVNLTFSGYLRENGKTGTRNELWIIATNGCVKKTADKLADICALRYGEIDGVTALTHPYGCSQTGEDQQNTINTLSALAKNPNAGGVLILGLGCENCHSEIYKELLPKDANIEYLTLQTAVSDLEDALKLTDKLVKRMRSAKRLMRPISELVLGLKCGGSDGLSGITANPLVGVVSDSLLASGGSALLTEVPEMFGGEAVLLAKAKNQEVFDLALKMIEDFKAYYSSRGERIDENPSYGNKAGGITTLAEKSLGCICKAGGAEINDVIKYGERIKTKGLTLLSAPGNDLVSSTALAAAGATLILFTTGRGTPFGSVVPTLKISSNTPLCQMKPGWIDFDAGKVLTDNREKLKIELLKLIVSAASGNKTKNEINGYKDIALFKTGVTL